MLVSGLLLATLVSLALDMEAKPVDDLPVAYARPIALVDTMPESFLEHYFEREKQPNPFDLRNPPAVQRSMEYDPESRQYTTRNRIGERYMGMPETMTFSEYIEYQAQSQKQEYFDILTGRSPQMRLGEVGEPIVRQKPAINLIETLFGSDVVRFNPRGSVAVLMNMEYRNNADPTLNRRGQRNFIPVVDMDMDLSITGQVGEKLNFNMNWNPKSTFDFDRNIKIGYDSRDFSDDDIIKGVEVGNISFPLNNSLIQGSQNMFGFKLTSQFGKLRLTTLFAQQRTEQNNLTAEGGGIEYEFEIEAIDYDENRHFFLGHYFKEAFDTVLFALPQILTQVQITRLEVWITNDLNEARDARQIAAIADLGEADPQNLMAGRARPLGSTPRDRYGYRLPDNTANNVYGQIPSRNVDRTRDNIKGILETNLQAVENEYEIFEGRQLRPSEYTFHNSLGFISLRRALEPDQSLAVAFEYEYEGQKYQVGEMTFDVSTTGDTTSSELLVAKMLRENNPNVGEPLLWDLMMKNFYNLRAFGLERETFQMDVFYKLPELLPSRYLPERFLPEGAPRLPLLTYFRLDRSNVTGDPQPDGEFDFVPGLTINPTNGFMMFPVREPFGSFLTEQLRLPDSLAFTELYDTSKFQAEAFPEKNRFLIKGRYKTSNGNIIPLNSLNVPQGSVVVRAAGQVLIEGVDYRVDYGGGFVEILNAAYLGPGVRLDVSIEDQSLFGVFNQRTMLGLRADYQINKDFNIGASLLNLYERPFTQKVEIGSDPINNWMYGLDLSYRKEAPFLTRWLEKIPLLNVQGESSIDIKAEAALLRPGHSRAIDNSGEGLVVIDDFEGSSFRNDIRNPVYNWVMSSVPRNPNLRGVNASGDLAPGLEAGFGRSRMSWYNLEFFFYENLNETDAIATNPYTRPIEIEEVFRNRDVLTAQNNNLRTLDIHFDPTRRGPYNFDAEEGFVDRTDTDGGVLFEENSLKSRWGGMQADLVTQNFEAANVELIEFWMLDPFLVDERENGIRTQNRDGGKLYFNLGDISEDIIPDGEYSFENGNPVVGEADTRGTNIWGRYPTGRNVTRAWDAEPANRMAQDIGYDGLNNEAEAEIFGDYLSQFEVGHPVYQDPSGDDYRSFRDLSLPANIDPRERFESYNHPDGNSEISEGTEILAAINEPDNEDINFDNQLNTSDNYLEYEVDLRRGEDGRLVNKYIVDEIVNPVNGQEERWYLFRVPISQPSDSVGTVGELRSVRWMRMYLTDFEQPVTLRFATLDLIRNTWRKYNRDLRANSFAGNAEENEGASLTVTSVNIEENSGKTPFNYVLPPDIQREQLFQGVGATRQNEQSYLLDFRNLKDNFGLGIFKNVRNLDLRDFDNLKLFVHLEDNKFDEIEQEQMQDNSMSTPQALDTNDIDIFIRIGDDLENNYYEIRQPLVPSDSVQASMLSRLDAEYREVVWPAANVVDIPLKELVEMKKERERLNQDRTSPYPYSKKIQVGETDNFASLQIVGNPNLGRPRSILIGVYNSGESGDVGFSGEVWVNELSLTGLNEMGGTAATGSIDLQLADFARVTFSGDYSSIGFGQIGDNLIERNKERLTSFAVNTNVQLGNFFKPEWGVQIPFYYQYAQDLSTPNFDEVYGDVFRDDAIDLADEVNDITPDEVRSRSRISETRRNIGFTDVRVAPQSNSVPKPWSSSNFSVSYEESRIDYEDPIIELDQTVQRQGGLNYNYAAPDVAIEPFKNLSKSKFLKPLTEFNFNLLPSSIGFSTRMMRLRRSRAFRNTPEDVTPQEWVTKRFTWDRDYNLSWNFTRSLTMRFSAANQSVIDELNENPDVLNPTADFSYSEAENRDLIWEGIRNFGRTQNYTQSLDLSYELPFKHFPYLEFIRANVNARAGYTWAAAPQFGIGYVVDSSLLTIGNTITNSQDRRANITLDMSKLYDQIGYLKRIDDYRMEGNKSEEEEGNGERTRGERRRKDDERRPISLAEAILIRPILSIKRFDFSVTQTVSSQIPGYQDRTQLFGMSPNWQNPGWNYILGFEPDEEFYLDLGSQGLITRSDVVRQDLTRSDRLGFNMRLELEPYRNLQINLDARKNTTINESEQYNTAVVDGQLVYDPWSPQVFGSMDMSFIGLNTLFDNDHNELFQRLEFNRIQVANLLNEEYNIPDEYIENSPEVNSSLGFGADHQNVLLPSFIAAYQGVEPDRDFLDVYNLDFPLSSRNLFSNFPRPNWNINFTGLKDLPFLQDRVSNVALTHSYSGNMRVSSFQNNRDFRGFEPDDIDSNINLANNRSFYTVYEFGQVLIDERFNPLVGLQITTKSNVELGLSYNIARTLDFSFSNRNLRETRSDGLQFDVGYQIRNAFIGLFHSKLIREQTRRSRQQRRRGDEESTDPSRDRGRRNRSGGNQSGLTLGFSVAIDENATYIHTIDRDGFASVEQKRNTLSVAGNAAYQVNRNVTVSLNTNYSRRENAVARGGAPVIEEFVFGIQGRYLLN